MKTKIIPTGQEILELTGFRQEVYSNLNQRCEAQFELIDALLQSRYADCLAELSLAPSFRRGWSSIYSVIEDGKQKTEELHKLCLRQVPFSEIEYYVIDASAWRRSSSETLKDRGYVHSATHEIGSKGIVVGHEWSILAWTEKPHSSWSIPVNIKRIATDTDAVTVAVQQIKWLCDNKHPKTQCRVALDGSYGNKHFFGLAKDIDCDKVARLRKDRVMYCEPGSYSGNGRPAKYGEKFRFKDPTTWHEPDETIQFDDEHYGQVKLQLWKGLRFEYPHEIVEIDVVRACVHTEKEKPPEPRWYGWQGKETSAEDIWRSFLYRWPVEPSIRFRKEHLHWLLPQTRTVEAAELWTMIVTLAQWYLFLARDIVADCRLPWQKKLSQLTPSRVRQALAMTLPMFGTPTSPPQTRGKSPGWTKGRLRTRPKRYDIIKKLPKNKISKKISRQAA